MASTAMQQFCKVDLRMKKKFTRLQKDIDMLKEQNVLMTSSLKEYAIKSHYQRFVIPIQESEKVLLVNKVTNTKRTHAFSQTKVLELVDIDEDHLFSLPYDKRSEYVFQQIQSSRKYIDPRCTVSLREVDAKEKESNPVVSDIDMITIATMRFKNKLLIAKNNTVIANHELTKQRKIVEKILMEEFERKKQTCIDMNITVGTTEHPYVIRRSCTMKKLALQVGEVKAAVYNVSASYLRSRETYDKVKFIEAIVIYGRDHARLKPDKKMTMREKKIPKKRKGDEIGGAHAESRGRRSGRSEGTQ